MRSSRHDDRRSPRESPQARRTLPFLLFFGIVTIACLCAAARWGLSHGILIASAGAVILCFPPRYRQHPGWAALGLAWLGCGLLAFLPDSFGGSPEWRQSLAAAGIGIPHLITPQPRESAIILAQTAALGIAAIWITGHGGTDRTRAALSFAFAGMVSALCALDLALRSVEGSLPHQADFGFFPNRNHSACLVVMAAITALGLLVHGVRRRRPSEFLVACVLLLFLLLCLLGRSSSRAGVLLLIPAVLIWAVLLGRDHLKGNAGKACGLLLLATSLGFVLAETQVKQRLSGTLRGLSETSAPWNPAGSPHSPPDEADGRLVIARDAMGIIRDMPWTGCGAGQFRYVFPQYRSPSAAMDGSDVLHPESSWLWIATETGIPSALIVFTLGVWVLVSAARESRRPDSRCRALRCACVAAAAVPLIHGFMDVSPHRAGILWSAALLVSITLPLDRRKAGSVQSWSWRITGGVLLAFGALLLVRHSIRMPLLPSEAADRLLKQSWNDYQRETAATRPADPAPPTYRGQDPLLAGIDRLGEAAELTPMEGRTYGLLGTLALHFDDKDGLADQSFARQRALNPSWIRLPLMQADAWKRIDPARTGILWKEALGRARTADSRLARPRFEKETTDLIRKSSASTPALQQAAREATGSPISFTGEGPAPADAAD